MPNADNRPSRFVRCRFCYRNVELRPRGEETYMSAFIFERNHHESIWACPRNGYGDWQFDPDWDRTLKAEPRWIKEGKKVLIEDKKEGVYRMDTPLGS